MPSSTVESTLEYSYLLYVYIRQRIWNFKNQITFVPLPVATHTLQSAKSRLQHSPSNLPNRGSDTEIYLYIWKTILKHVDKIVVGIDIETFKI